MADKPFDPKHCLKLIAVNAEKLRKEARRDDVRQLALLLEYVGIMLTYLYDTQVKMEEYLAKKQ